MKKSWSLPGTLVLFSSVLFSWAQPGEAAPVRLVPISSALYQVLGGRGANGGAYIGDDGVLLIDAKQDRVSEVQVLSEIRKITDRPIRYLVDTHSDGDHVQGNRYVPAPVTIIAQENCRREFFHVRRDGTASEWNDPELAPFIPSVTYRDKMTLYLGSKKVELWYFGVGHTTGDTVVYFPEERTVFLGDQVFFGRPQLIHSYKGGNSFAHVATLTKMLDTLDAVRFCSGHSDPVDRSAIRTHILQMKQMQAKVASLEAAGKGIDEIKSEFTPRESALVETIYTEIRQRNQ
jgi:cyclase